jgi:hypothetical protein
MTTPKRAHFSTAFTADKPKLAVPESGSTSAAQSESSNPQQKSRINKVQIPVYVSPDVRVQLKILSAELGRTQEDLLREAINDLFQKNGKPSIA